MLETMTRKVLVLSVVLSFWPTSCAPATQLPRMCGGGSITVSGIVHGFATVQEEPSASPQSSFTLQMPSCGTADVLVSAPAPIFCAEGDKATVTGEYLRPSKLNPVPVISPAHVDCTPRTLSAAPSKAGHRYHRRVIFIVARILLKRLSNDPRSNGLSSFAISPPGVA